MKRMLLDAGMCLGCRTCENVCAAVHSRAGSFTGAVLAGEKPHSGVKIMQSGSGEIFAKRLRVRLYRRAARLCCRRVVKIYLHRFSLCV